MSELNTQLSWISAFDLYYSTSYKNLFRDPQTPLLPKHNNQGCFEVHLCTVRSNDQSSISIISKTTVPTFTERHSPTAMSVVPVTDDSFPGSKWYVRSVEQDVFSTKIHGRPDTSTQSIQFSHNRTSLPGTVSGFLCRSATSLA